MLGGRLQPSPAVAALSDLVAHIVSVHHKYLERELPALEAFIAQTQSGTALARVFPRFRRELESHLKKEEQVLFPLLIEIEQAHSSGERPRKLPYGSIAHPIAMMEQEHEFSRRDLLTISKLTNHYTAPDDANEGLREVCRRLVALDNDLQQHSRLEDEILFPRAIELESACEARTA